MSNSRLSRRTVLGGGLVVFASTCGRTELDPDEPPLAQWPEDEDMPQPTRNAGLTQPIMLWGSVVAAPNADSPVPNEQLANPFPNLPIELLGIRFRLTPQTDEAGAAPRVTGGGVKVKLDLGAASVATDIPISIFGDNRDTYENQTSCYVDDPLLAATIAAVPTTYDWRLRYPMYIPPGKVLTAVFTPIGLNAFPVRIDVLYMCRTWDPNRSLPAKVKVPWAASFESKTFPYEDNAPPATSVSSALDVLNPFGVPLELERIGGRCTTLQLAGTGNTRYIVEDLGEWRDVLSTLRMRSSRGFDLIRTPVPFNGVFPANWRAWDITDGWTMAAREYYRVQIDTAAVDDVTINPEAVANAQFCVGIVGYRDVEVATLNAEVSP